ncbi:MAG: AsmA family protein [Candidatus Omnitrophica bacterium]|nr:AsmA family protein [Candidatus Omnitrophota bacterium]
MKIIKYLIFTLGILSLIIIILLGGTFYAAKHLRLKDIIEKEIEESLGINVSIGEIAYSPLLAHIWLKQITIHNPAGFSGDELAYIEYLHFIFDPLELIVRKKPNIYLTAVNLKRLNIIKSKEGKINLKELIPVKNGSNPQSTGSPSNPFYFDVLVLSIGEVRYTDENAHPRKEVKYNIGIKDAAFVGLTDENAVVKMIVYKAIQNTDIGKLINLTVVPVFSAISNTVDSAWSTAKIGSKGIWEIGTLPLKLILGGN